MRPRLVLFAVVCGALVASAVAFSRGGYGSSAPATAPAPARSSVEAAAWARRVEARVSASAARLRAAARPFLSAFARYEVGDVGVGVRLGLRRAATSGFARRLLASPPRPSRVGGFVGRARIERLDTRFVAADASRALVSGRFRRGALPEEFAFLFVRRAGGWRASGPGE